MNAREPYRGVAGAIAAGRIQARKAIARRQATNSPPPVPGARWIPLSQGQWALIDESDYEAVSRYTWHLDRMPHVLYARTNLDGGRRGKRIRLHNFIMGVTGVDHVNGDGLDNRRSNLRRATKAQNGRNCGLRKNNTSGFKGVTFNRQRGSWQAQLSDGGKSVNLGQFDTPAAAAMAHDKEASSRFGAFARLNFPKEQA